MPLSGIRGRAAIVGIGQTDFGKALGRSEYDMALDTEEGVHFVSQVLDCPPEAIFAGMPVAAVFVPVSDEITLVKFQQVGRDGYSR